VIVGPKCHAKGITGYGNPDHGVVIIGIAPGRDEIRTGRPFTGVSGKLLDNILRSVGWPREKVYTTNLVCWNIDQPSTADIAACATRLKAELEQLHPKVIFLMGKIVTEAFIPDCTFSKVRGAVQWINGSWVISTYHPAAIVRGGVQFINDLVKDLSKIKYVTTWPQDNSYGDIEYTLIRSQESAQELLNTLPLNIPVALDVETDSLSLDKGEYIDVFGENIISIAISTGAGTWVIPQKYSRGLIWPKSVQWTFHNGLYDVQAMRLHLGVELPIVHDTMLQSYTLDERNLKGLHSLKSLSRQWVGAGFYEEEITQYKKVGYQEAPKKALHKYNAYDAAYTARLQPVFHSMQVEDEVCSVYDNLLIPAANVFSDIQYRGVRIDQDRVRELSLEWLPRWLDGEKELQTIAAEGGWDRDEPINTNSPKQLSHFLYDILGMPGGPSTNKETLAVLADEHPFITKLLKFRQLDHMINTYLQGIQDDVKRDGRVHANCLLHGTVTGRLSYTNPPLQTIPQAGSVGDDLARIRTIFVPSNMDTHVVVEVDYGKAELWCAYYYSKDPAMLEDLMSADYHTAVASRVYKKPANQITKNERKAMKYVTFGIMYGRQAPDLAHGELKCSIVQAQQYIDAWKARNYIYVQWTDKIKAELMATGEVVSATGRKRRFYYIDNSSASDVYNKAVNFPVQCLASDCTLSTLIELHPILLALDSYLWFPIHDSIVMEVSKANLSTALRELQRVFTNPRFPGMPSIPIEISVGPRWGECKEIDLAS
jgi:DNA polymerase-1